MFLIRSDGKTPHERIRGRHYNGEVVEFSETVNNKLPVGDLSKADSRWGLGIWLGKSLSSDEHYVGTENGVSRMRSIWRKVEAERWNKAALDRMVGSPWEPVPPGMKPKQKRHVYITLERAARHGWTVGCPRCHDWENKKVEHSPACIERFSKFYPGETQKEEMKVERPEVTTTEPTTKEPEREKSQERRLENPYRVVH